MKTPAHITGHLFMRFGDNEVDLGTVDVPLRFEHKNDGNLVLTAETRQVVEYLQAVFGREN